MGLTLVTPSTGEPVSVDELKTHCQVEHSADNDYLYALGVAARRYCEAYLGQQFMPATWRLSMDGFSDPLYAKYDGSLNRLAIRIPKAPLISVSSIGYTAADGTTATWSSTAYVVDTVSRPGRLTTAVTDSWPATINEPNSVELNFTCGYQTTGGTAATTAVPAGTRTAIKMLVYHWYEMRAPVVAGTITSAVPMSVDSLLAMEGHGAYVA